MYILITLVGNGEEVPNIFNKVNIFKTQELTVQYLNTCGDVGKLFSIAFFGLSPIEDDDKNWRNYNEVATEAMIGYDCYNYDLEEKE